MLLIDFCRWWVMYIDVSKKPEHPWQKLKIKGHRACSSIYTGFTQLTADIFSWLNFLLSLQLSLKGEIYSVYSSNAAAPIKMWNSLFI